MKNALIIAVLLLGVVGCAKTEKPLELTRVESEIKHPPLIWGTVCTTCGIKNDWGQWYCMTLWEDNETGPIYYQSCLKAVNRTAGFYDMDVLRKVNLLHPETQMEPDLDTTFLDDFVENWLLEFPKGAQFYGHFEFISHVAFINGIPTLDVPAHYAFLRDSYAVADSLMNGSWGCIPITSTYKSDAEDMIDYYRLKLDEPLFQSALDSIQAGLGLYEGKTRAQMYDLFEGE